MLAGCLEKDKGGPGQPYGANGLVGNPPEQLPPELPADEDRQSAEPPALPSPGSEEEPQVPF